VIPDGLLGLIRTLSGATDGIPMRFVVNVNFLVLMIAYKFVRC
jgi:hypothetical protein